MLGRGLSSFCTICRRPRCRLLDCQSACRTASVLRQSAKSMSSAIFTCLSAKFTDREILIQICAKFVEIYRSGKFAPKCKLNASNKFAAPGLARGLKCAYLNYTAIECGCQVLILRKLSANPAQIFSGPRSGVCKFCAIGWEFLQNLSKLKKSS